MFCAKVKEFLSRRGVQFTERDVSKDEAAVNELKQMNIMMTPVTVINGDTVTGFDHAKLEALLKD